MTDVAAHFDASAEALRDTAVLCADDIVQVAAELADAVRGGGKILLCGNGGSAADAQHFAAELVGRLERALERPAIPAVALTTDACFLTAWANDTDFADVFVRQVEALARAGDVLVLISTSGNSPNVVAAAEAARERGVLSVGLLGGDGGELASLVDRAVIVPCEKTQHVQECHAAVIHVVCSLVERALYAPAAAPPADASV